MSNAFANVAGGPPRGSYVKIARTYRAKTFTLGIDIHNPESRGLFHMEWGGEYARYGEALLVAQVWRANGYYLKDDVGEVGVRQ
jgi:hypothetical protein